MRSKRTNKSWDIFSKKKFFSLVKSFTKIRDWPVLKLTIFEKITQKMSYRENKTKYLRYVFCKKPLWFQNFTTNNNLWTTPIKPHCDNMIFMLQLMSLQFFFALASFAWSLFFAISSLNKPRDIRVCKIMIDSIWGFQVKTCGKFWNWYVW